jgi:hypothetical protein
VAAAQLTRKLSEGKPSIPPARVAVSAAECRPIVAVGRRDDH